MIDDLDQVDRGKVIEGVELDGHPNVSDEIYEAHIRAAIRRHLPQLRDQPSNYDRVALLGNGPSLNDTLDELNEVLRDGAKLVTTNGAYHWALEHNLRPQTQVVLDARASNVRFVEPAIPHCNYLIASTCHPDVFDAVEGRPNVFVFHPFVRKKDPTTNSPVVADLDAYYLGHWVGVPGGTTVVSRALCALRTLGYVRFDLFGVDSCYLHGQHHANAQPENDADQQYRVKVSMTETPDDVREFACTGWHLVQVQDFLRLIRFHGQHFQLAVHGDGLLAHALQASANLVTEPWAPGSQSAA